MRLYELFQKEDKDNVTHVNFQRDKTIKVNPTEPQKAYDAFIGDYLPFNFSNGMELNLMDEDYDPNYTVWVLNDVNGKQIEMGEKADDLVNLLQSMTHIPIQQDVANYDEGKLQENQQLPQEVQSFVNSLTPDDVGVDTVGKYIVHYEGFTDQCNDGHDEESIDDVYADVYRDFDQRQGIPAMLRGVAHDDLGCENNPVLYSVYKNVNERNLNPAVKDYVKGKKTKLIKVKVADLDDEANDDRFGRVIDTDPDVGVDLDKPILLDKDGKTILDGFHRVYQAKRVGRDVIPAEIIDENFADGKKKGKSRPGRVKRSGASCKGSVTSLRAKAKKYSGERGKMYHWCANMKGGKNKKKKTNEGMFDQLPLPTWMSHTSLEKMFRQEYGDQYGDYLAYMDLDSDDDAAMSSDFGDMALDIAKDHDLKEMNKFLSQMPVQFKVDDLRLDKGIQVWHLVQQPTTVH